MPKVFVVDDEETIRAGISSIIGRLAPHWQAVECKDARSAIERIPADRPELMVIDISMPGMDGLELAEYLKEREPDILKIILTGYDKFSYVQGALRAEAVDYLLKPVIREELLAALGKADRLLAERRSVRRQAEEARAGRLRQALEDLLCGAYGSEEKLAKLLREEDPGSTDYLLLLAQGASSEITSVDRLTELVAALRTDLAEVSSASAFFVDSGSFLLFAAGQALSVDRARRWWRRTLRSSGETPIAGETFADLALLPEAYVNLIGRLYRSENEADAAERAYDDNRLRDRESRLLAALETDDPELLRTIIGEELGSLKRWAAEKSAPVRLSALHFIVRALLPALNRTDSRLSRAARPVAAGLLSGLVLPGSKMETVMLLGEFERRIGELSSQFGDAGEKNRTIETVKAYIREHYGDSSLRLETLAGVVHMNANYVSNLFKEATGENYLHYLTSVRMEKAKKMLRETTLKTYEIADRAGYSSTRYFCKLFRQLHGMTPSEYRHRSHLSAPREEHL